MDISDHPDTTVHAMGFMDYSRVAKIDQIYIDGKLILNQEPKMKLEREFNLEDTSKVDLEETLEYMKKRDMGGWGHVEEELQRRKEAEYGPKLKCSCEYVQEMTNSKLVKCGECKYINGDLEIVLVEVERRLLESLPAYANASLENLRIEGDSLGWWYSVNENLWSFWKKHNPPLLTEAERLLENYDHEKAEECLRKHYKASKVGLLRRVRIGSHAYSKLLRQWQELTPLDDVPNHDLVALHKNLREQKDRTENTIARAALIIEKVENAMKRRLVERPVSVVFGKYFFG